MNLSELIKPFPAEDIEWRIQRAGMTNGKPWALVLAYVTNRAIMERLDDVCGPENWCNHYAKAPDGGVLCGISIRISDAWVCKWDGAQNTDFEPVKGGLSGAMKRAAVQWGIGRYLYKLDATFANCTMENATAWNRGTLKHECKTVYFRWETPALPAWALPVAKTYRLNSADNGAGGAMCPDCGYPAKNGRCANPARHE